MKLINFLLFGIASAATCTAIAQSPAMMEDGCNVTDPQVLAILNSQVSLINNGSGTEVTQNPDGTYNVKVTPLTTYGGYPFTSTSIYYGTPQATGRSGVLIAQDRILTAGHTAPFDLSPFVVVFGLSSKMVNGTCVQPTLTADQSAWIVPAADVYFPNLSGPIINTWTQTTTGHHYTNDYLVFQLDRFVPTTRIPLKMRTAGAPIVGANYSFVSHPLSLSAKSDQHAIYNGLDGNGFEVVTNAAGLPGSSGGTFYNLGEQLVEAAASWGAGCGYVQGYAGPPQYEEIILNCATSASATVGFNSPIANANISISGQATVLVTGSDKAAWQIPTDDGHFGAWQALPQGQFNSAPTIVQSSPTQWTAIGQSTNGGLSYSQFNGQTWSTWAPITSPTGQTIVYDPSAISTAPNSINLFTVAQDNITGNRAVWQSTFNGTSWSTWQSLGGTLKSSPAVAKWGTQLAVFAVASDNAVWYTVGSGSSWGSWTRVGAPAGLTAAFGPAAVTRSNGRVDVFVVASNQAAYTISYNAGWPASWTSLGGALVSGPAAASWGTNQETVYALGTDHHLWFNETYGSSWTGWLSAGSPGNQNLSLRPAVLTTDAASTQLANLGITKFHTGTFSQGQSGATYTLWIDNQGPSGTSGYVYVTDNLPSGMTATAISGTGWSCNLYGLTCNRNDILPAGHYYPPIIVTGYVHPDAPDIFTNIATLSGGGDATPANNSAYETTGIAPLVPSSTPDLAVWLDPDTLTAHAMNVSSAASFTNVHVTVSTVFQSAGPIVSAPSNCSLTSRPGIGATATFDCLAGTLTPGDTIDFPFTCSNSTGGSSPGSMGASLGQTTPSDSNTQNNAMSSPIGCSAGM